MGVKRKGDVQNVCLYEKRKVQKYTGRIENYCSMPLPWKKRKRDGKEKKFTALHLKLFLL